MTHLSDLSYIQRSVSTSWFYGWFLVYVFRWDRFEALRLRRLLRFELRSVVTLLVLISLGLQLAYDIGSARLKYLEGFWVNPRTKEIQSRPAQAWSDNDMVHVEPLYYTLACCLAFENCVFFLLQAFWSYISKSVTKSSFMSSFEFKINITASCFVVALFPTVQFLFRNDFVYREVVPQMIFSILMFITGVLGIRTHFRFVALIKNARAIMNETTTNVVHKLEYFKDMNMVLTVSFFGCALALGITSADGLLAHPVIAVNKFASDLLITNLNFFEFIIWVTLTLIFYPRKTGVSSPFGSSNQSVCHSQKPGLKEAHLPRFNDIRPQDENSYRKVEDIEGAGSLELYVIDSDASTGHLHTLRHHHHRSLSGQSKQAMTSPAPLPPATSPAAAISATARTSTNTDKPALESRTIYYHEALLKAQLQQRQNQANEEYAQATGEDTAPQQAVSTAMAPYDAEYLPQRSFSQDSQYSLYSHRTMPNRGMSPDNQRPRITSNNPGRHTPSVDYRPAREFPSLDQVKWSRQSNTPHAPSAPSNLYPQPVHPRDGRDSAMAAAAAPLHAVDHDDDGDQSIIHIGYVRRMTQDNVAAVVACHGSFYDGVGQDDAGYTATAVADTPRPYSPRKTL
ncbi:hypothetical protein BGX28_007029 [Mortierella sp. GBA30]|nr:hypothetical protein BGX28_007029 [Mortierella sp. GBA30]